MMRFKSSMQRWTFKWLLGRLEVTICIDIWFPGFASHYIYSCFSIYTYKFVTKWFGSEHLVSMEHEC